MCARAIPCVCALALCNHVGVQDTHTHAHTHTRTHMNADIGASAQQSRRCCWGNTIHTIYTKYTIHTISMYTIYTIYTTYTTCTTYTKLSLSLARALSTYIYMV